MAQQTVHHCDWCTAVVKTDDNGQPQFAARIVAKPRTPIPTLTVTPASYDICTRCNVAFKALTEGKYRR